MPNETIPILFDTDIGSDIDDAVALAYLLAQPRCELLGVTTVTGQSAVRAQLVDAVCRAFGRDDVPIFSGAARPMLIEQKQTDVPQRVVLDRYPHREGSFGPENAAVDFLRQTIRSRPGEITLLSVGPLTNIGLLFALDPEIPGLLKEHVMMGGLYGQPVEGYGAVEWNASGDPHATAIVFGRSAGLMRCVGLDVTTRCKMAAGVCRERFGRGRLRIVGEMAEAWFERRPQITFHDPLAAASVFESSLLRYQTGRVTVELRDEGMIGQTRFCASGSDRLHQVAVEVDRDAFFGHYFEVVGG